MALLDSRGNRALVELIILGLLMLAGITLFAFRILTEGSVLDGEELRFAAERILFLGILLALIFLLIGSGLFIRGLRTDRRLSRLVEQSRYRRLSLNSDFRGFGRLGNQMRDLYGGILELNEMMGRKIGAQGTLIDLLSTNSSARMLVTDSAGKVLFVSKVLLEEIEQEKQQVVGSSVEGVWEEIQFTDLRAQLEEQLQAVETQTASYPLTAFPVSSGDGLIAYVVFNAERRPFLYTPKTVSTQKRSPNPIQRELNRLFKLGRRKEEPK